MNTKMLKTIDEIIIRASSLVTTILEQRNKFNNWSITQMNQQQFEQIEQVFEKERENKEAEALFEGSKHDED